MLAAGVTHLVQDAQAHRAGRVYVRVKELGRELALQNNSQDLALSPFCVSHPIAGVCLFDPSYAVPSTVLESTVDVVSASQETGSWRQTLGGFAG